MQPVSRGFKVLVAVVSGLMAVAGAVAFGVYLTESLEGTAALESGVWMAGFMTVFFGGGLFTFVETLKSLRGARSPPFRIPNLAVLPIVFLFVVALGEYLLTGQGEGGRVFPWLLVLGAAIPPLAVVGLAAARLGAGPQAPTVRRVGVAMFAGSTVSILAAILLEILLPLVVVSLVVSAGSLVRDFLDELTRGTFAGRPIEALTQPDALAFLAVLAVMAPLAEEFVKPIGVWVLNRRIPTAAHALMVGMACGAGFGIIENILYESIGHRAWAGVVLVRAVGAALHPLCAGLVSLGWYAVYTGAPGRWRTWWRCFGAAVGIHALWNAASGIFALMEGERFAGGAPWRLDLYGTPISLFLICFLVAQGVLMLGGVVVLAERVKSAGVVETAAPTAIQKPERALALWALACLGLLLPLGLSAIRAILAAF